MTQERALQIMLEARNTFLTGPPGSGKTYLLNKFIEIAKKRGKRVAITATTGIAATHISGQTINSWAGIGLGKRLRNINPKALKDRFNNTDILVIDEISMMNSRTFDLVDIIARINRQNNEPFGGIQVITVGDFFQLPPVAKQEKVKYVYKSLVWADLNLAVCYLEDQHRQKDGDDLTKILLSIRKGSFGNIEQKIVSKYLNILPQKITILRLLTHNYDAEQINLLELDKLRGKLKRYIALKSGPKDSVNLIKSQMLAPEELVLKVGSEIMFVVNNLKSGYVNGSRGIVKELSKDILVIKVYGGGYIKLKRHKFTLDSELYPKASIIQFPIKLSWAITIHKSQGMTLDEAVIDLSHAFVPNMGYVALSRLRSIDGLFMTAYNPMAFLINDEIRSIDEEFRKISAKLSA